MVIDCYLCTLQSLADTLSEACPPVGGPYRHRINRLRARLAFDPTPEAMEESCSVVARELIEYARQASAYLERREILTDPVTGLMNCAEMKRRVIERKAVGAKPALLLFAISCKENLPDEIAQQIAARLDSQFRYSDAISRWSEREFMVMFHGSVAMGRARADQILPCISGRYPLNAGGIFEVSAEVRVMDDLIDTIS